MIEQHKYREFQNTDKYIMNVILTDKAVMIVMTIGMVVEDTRFIEDINSHLVNLLTCS